MFPFFNFNSFSSHEKNTINLIKNYFIIILFLFEFLIIRIRNNNREIEIEEGIKKEEKESRDMEEEFKDEKWILFHLQNHQRKFIFHYLYLFCIFLEFFL